MGSRIEPIPAQRAARSPKGLRWLAFLIGIPVCLIPLWFFFVNASRLLPAAL